MHHLFGAEVSEMVKAAYGDAFLTAHFEVCVSVPVLPRYVPFGLLSLADSAEWPGESVGRGKPCKVLGALLGTVKLHVAGQSSVPIMHV